MGCHTRSTGSGREFLTASVTMKVMRYIDQRQFHQIAGRGDATGAAVERLGSVARVADNGSRVVSFCFSDGSVDRMGDVINPQGWDTKNFLKNPVALFAHDSSSPPIGRVRRTYVSGDRFMGDIEFAGPETYEFADTIYRLVTDGFIRACSVGFMPLEWQWAEEKSRPGGIDFERCELLEISVVPVPANANALVEARAKSLGYTRISQRPAPALAPTPLSYAGTHQQRLAQLHYDRPDLAPGAQIECQIRAVQRIGHDGTPAGMRRWAKTLQWLHKRALR
jgi:HK97 family phage prohead protease